MHLLDQRFRSPIAGLDISDQSIKYFFFRTTGKSGATGLSASGEFAVPEGIIVKGEIKNEGELVRLISGWRTEEKEIPAGAFFSVSLPEEKSFLRVIQLPRMKEEEISHAIRWEIEANIPLAFEEMMYDYEIITPTGTGEQPDHLDVIVTAFPKALVDSYVRVLRGAGLPLAALGLESEAIARAIVGDFHDGIPRIIADIGRTRTSLIVCIGGVLMFTTTIELGGQVIENSLAKAFQISQEEALHMKMRIGLDRKERNGAVFEALLPVMAVLGDELGRVVEYYQHHAAHMHGVPDTIASVMLVGGDANLLGIETYLSSALRLPVAVADPFIGVYPANAFTLPPLRKNESLTFATAIGLALWGIRT
jgi:type IV pilus assembly protein PilM